MELLKICLRDNFAGTQSSRLYAETFYGTKDAIEGISALMHVWVVLKSLHSIGQRDGVCPCIRKGL